MPCFDGVTSAPQAARLYAQKPGSTLKRFAHISVLLKPEKVPRCPACARRRGAAAVCGAVARRARAAATRLQLAAPVGGLPAEQRGAAGGRGRHAGLARGRLVGGALPQTRRPRGARGAGRVSGLGGRSSAVTGCAADGCVTYGTGR